MVFMRMRKNYSIQLFYSGSQHLVTKIRCGVNHQCSGFALHQNTAAQALVFLSVDVQTGQLHPIIGTPLLVPVPKNVIFKGGQCTM